MKSNNKNIRIILSLSKASFFIFADHSSLFGPFFWCSCCRQFCWNQEICFYQRRNYRFSKKRSTFGCTLASLIFWYGRLNFCSSVCQSFATFIRIDPNSIPECWSFYNKSTLTRCDSHILSRSDIDFCYTLGSYSCYWYALYCSCKIYSTIFNSVFNNYFYRIFEFYLLYIGPLSRRL